MRQSGGDARVPLLEIAWSYLKLGATAFGGPLILKEIRWLALKKRWLSESELNHGFGMVQLYPGPIGMDFVTYIGYRLRGVPGGLIAAAAFLFPAFWLMVLLSHLYLRYGKLPEVSNIFLGLEALVLGLLFNYLLELLSKSVSTWRHALLAVAAFAALLVGLNPLYIVAAALLFGAGILSPRGGEGAETCSFSQKPPLRRVLAIGAVAGTVIFTALLCLFSDSLLGRMGLAFFKIGSIAFGSGATILPLIQAEVVSVNEWLTPSQFADGIALGQVTPGPFLITATFAGYKMLGFQGAVLSTFAIFSPSIAMTLVFTELLERHKNHQRLKGALAGVMASFAGLLGILIIGIGKVALHGPASYVFAALAFAASRFLGLNAALVFAAGLPLWGAVSFLAP